MHYVLNYTRTPPSCLPSNLDEANLVDITQVQDSWRKYLDTSTGRIHDGGVYYKLAVNQGTLEPHRP